MIIKKRCYATDGVSTPYTPTKADMSMRIKTKYHSIRNSIRKLCSTCDPEDIRILSMYFDGMRNISEHVAELGSNITYDRYTDMIKELAQCEASLIKLKPKRTGDETWTLDKDALASFCTSVKLLYSSIEKLIVNLSK